MPAEYMFKDVPMRDDDAPADPVAVTLDEMDRFGIEVGLLSLGVAREHAERALREHPDRFVASLTLDPNRGMDGIRELVAPRYYAQAIVDYANSRGADRIHDAGYFPMGMSLERIFGEMPGVPFKDDVWPGFLRHNAARLLGLEER